MRSTIASTFLFCLFFLFSCEPQAPNNEKKERDPRPNILLILLDDLGYSDLGCFGGEIPTPNLDALAAEGVRFSGFRTAPMGGPSRAQLMTGNDNHISGHGRMLNPLHEAYRGIPGYEYEFSKQVVSFPTLLQDAGYYTCITGKWNLGIKAQSNPKQQGFEDSWVLLEDASNYYNNIGLGLYGSDTITHFTSNGLSAPYPEGTFATDFYTDQIISYLNKNAHDSRPFFAMAAYTAPHWPLQPPREYINKYKGFYEEGYDVLREKRFKGLQEKGIIPADRLLPVRINTFKPWFTLFFEEQRRESREMELYAALVNHLDDNIGRLIKNLKELGLYENTIIIVASDNGAGPENVFEHPVLGSFIRNQYDNTYENMGYPNSFVSYGNGWAQAAMAPFNGYKGQAYEGGIAAPLIVKGKMLQGPGSVKHEHLSILDLAPTFLDIAGATYPQEYKGQALAPLRGHSLFPYWKGEVKAPHDAEAVFALEHRGQAYVQKGTWKIVNPGGAYDNSRFQLFDLATDPGERFDLSYQNPQKKAELLAEWEKFKASVGIQFVEQ
ncbi:MAG: sulfatase-like hydrolase/transferase [Saprospiraceae bacterium]